MTEFKIDITVEPRKYKVIKLFGVNVILSERDAYEIARFVKFSMQNRTKLAPEDFLLQTAKIVETGLKYTYSREENTEEINEFQKKLSWLEKRRLKKKLKWNYLLENLSQAQINMLAEQLYELEGVRQSDNTKKKVKTKKKLPRSLVNK